jgi:hypothetical protein
LGLRAAVSESSRKFRLDEQFLICSTNCLLPYAWLIGWLSNTPSQRQNVGLLQYFVNSHVSLKLSQFFCFS